MAILLLSGCKGGPAEKPAPPPPSESLLFTVPYIGDETEIRDPAPAPSRLANFEESVFGWDVPTEGILRFPVNLREGARLAVRLGGVASEPLQLGEITAQIEFLSEREKNPIVLFQTGTEERIECFNRWLDIDISLSPCGTGKGEMKFEIDGDKVKNGQVKVHWGAPVIYYPDERRHKNVLLIGVDTLRRDSVTPYGENGNITPYLRALSETSTLFMQARSQCSWTLPSFASMVTGRVPSAIGANIYSGYVPDDTTTIGEMLLPQGYATETVCSNTWLGNDQSGFHQGMEGLWYRYDASAQAVVGRARSFIASSTGRDWFCF
ncbi:MAG: sulfatase-like hydrolase/transferase, partial [bacterium]